jgi:hypothetical protein
MNYFIRTLQLVGRMGRRTDIEQWGDARSKPFTEGQAVLNSGQIGPAAATRIDRPAA